jgi:hypothetical protein
MNQLPLLFLVSRQEHFKLKIRRPLGAGKLPSGCDVDASSPCPSFDRRLPCFTAKSRS